MERRYTPEELDQLHDTLYEVLGEVIRVCDKHGLPYFVIGGTAIGTLYDEGILPWDDDIDIGMRREDYERFLQIAPQELGPDYFLSWFGTEPHTPYYFAKVKKHHTSFVEPMFRDVPVHPGIFVDIFPFDRIPDSPLLQRLQHEAAKFLFCCLIGKETWIWKHFGTCRISHPTNRGPLPCLLNRVVDSLVPKRWIYGALKRVQTAFNGTKTTYYNNVMTRTDRVKESDLDALEGHRFGPLTATAPRDLEGFLRYNYPKLHRFTPDEVEKVAGHVPVVLSFDTRRTEAEGVDVAVLILFFNRPDFLKRTFEQIRKARPSRLFLYQDGPRSAKDLPGIEACRRVVSDIDWDCEVHRLYQEKNYGCDPSNFMAQKWAFSQADKCVVLEDDDVVAVSFFRFCKEMLDRYEHDPRITMIAGFNNEEVTPGVPDDYFFASTFSIWGWASWRRVVDQWDEHYSILDDAYNLEQLRALIRSRGYRKDFLPMCRGHRASGKAFYETIFHSCMMLQSGLAIVPTRNMVNNIGVTSDSTHFAGSVETLPRGYRRIFTMGRHEVEFPLRHPRYVIEHVAYKESVYRIMGWGHPWIKIGRSLEELALNLRYGNFKHIGKSIANRIRKWMGKKEYK
jgi:hypothetical protein